MSDLWTYLGLLSPVIVFLFWLGYSATVSEIEMRKAEIEEWRGTVDIALSGRGADADRMIARARDLYVRDMIDLEQFEDAVEDILWGDSWELLSMPEMGYQRAYFDGP